MKWCLVCSVLVMAAAVLLELPSSEAKRIRKFDGDFEFVEEDEAKSAVATSEKKRWIHDPSSDLCRPLNCKKKEMCLLEDVYTAVCVSKKELQKNGDIIVPKSTAGLGSLSAGGGNSASPAGGGQKLQQQQQTGADASQQRDDDMDDDDDDDVFYDIEDDVDDADEDSSDSVTCSTCPVVKPTFLCGNDNRTYSSLCRLDYHNCIHRTNIRVSCKGFCPCKENETHLRKKQRQQDRLNSFMNKYKATLDKTGSVSGPMINGEKPLGNSANSIQQQQQQQLQMHQQQQQAQGSDVYTFTPQDFKYENKHYKYIKYTKYNNKENSVLHADDKDHQRYNEVLDNKLYGGSNYNKIPATPPAAAPNKLCPPAALQAMGNRLLDWFSVVMADTTKRRRLRNKSKGGHFPAPCKPEVRWMFQHLDTSGDGRLSRQELYDLEHDQSEVCLRPFLHGCDADYDEIVTGAEWCRCYQRTERPCAAVKHKIAPDLLGVYVPDCDAEGYYKPVQCHSVIGLCWCVDKHGVEFANSRIHGKPTCTTSSTSSIGSDNKSGKSSANAGNANSVTANDDDEDDDDLDQDIEGSADQPHSGSNY